jgi:hypothetical protein
MTTLTLLVKTKHGAHIRAIAESLKDQFEELDVETEVLTNTANRWVQVSVSGEDEAIATSYLRKTYGLCPVTLENARTTHTFKAYISKVDEAKQQLQIDVGIFEPQIVPAIISEACLQTQLAEGKSLSIRKIGELFGLAEGIPLTIKVNWEKSSEGELSAELAPEQAAKFFSWRQSMLDRLIVIGTSLETVNTAIERTKLIRDIIDVETLGAFEFALTCKLGTDAAGLIPRIGRYMRYSVFVVLRAEKAWTL